jgi:hypothetical protein
MESCLLFMLSLFIMFWMVPPMPLALTPSLWPLWLAEAYQSLDAVSLTWVLLWGVLLWLCASLTAYSTPKALGMLLVWPFLQLAGTYAPVQWFLENGGDEAVVSLTGLCLAGYAVRMFLRARRKGLLSPVTAWLSLAAYLVLSYLIVQNIASHALCIQYGFFRADHMAWTIEILGAISLAVAPIAALPLQFDRWRHGGK